MDSINSITISKCYNSEMPSSNKPVWYQNEKTMRIAGIALLTVGAAIAAAGLIITFTAQPLFICGVVLVITGLGMMSLGMACLGVSSFISSHKDPMNSYLYKNQYIKKFLKATLLKEETLFYHKVLGSGKKREHLEGNKADSSIMSIINDLTLYAEKNNCKKDVYSRLIKELKCARDIASDAQDMDSNPTINYFLRKRIINEIHALPEQIEVDNGSAVVIPGGSARHAILYVIKRDIDGTFKFSIINTGAGLRRAAVGIDESSVAHIPKVRKMVDVTYRKLSKGMLSEKFIGELLEQKSKKNMTDVNKFIENRLLNKQLLNLQIGRQHKMQKNGTCSMKCLFAFLRNELGEQEYRKFKAWMTTEAIQKFKRYIEISPHTHNEYYKEMLQEAYAVLEKRKNKVSAL